MQTNNEHVLTLVTLISYLGDKVGIEIPFEHIDGNIVLPEVKIAMTEKEYSEIMIRLQLEKELAKIHKENEGKEQITEDMADSTKG